MNIVEHAKHIPTIEGWIRDLKPDALVCGMGATGWLLPWIDQQLLAGVRMFGSHDGCRMFPMDDLIIMDRNSLALSVDTERYNGVVHARPKRIWVYEKSYDSWLANLPECLHSITKPVNWDPWRGSINKKGEPVIGRDPFHLVHEPLHTGLVAGTGMTTLAWSLGLRRIGVIGVDMKKGHFPAWKNGPAVDHFFTRMAGQAHELGGAIRNLSPITALKRFAAWKPSVSSSGPTSGSAQPEPNSSLPTPSGSTQPAQSTSSSCEQATESGPSASVARSQEVGSSVGQST